MILTWFPGRLTYLDQTLQNIIKRFEDEYPETRIDESAPAADAAAVAPDSASEHSDHSLLTTTNTSASVTTDITHPEDSDSDTAEAPAHIGHHHHRSSSEVSLASRALSLEEGRIHRLGQRVRQDILRAPSPVKSTPPLSRSPAVPDANGSSSNSTTTTTTTTSTSSDAAADAAAAHRVTCPTDSPEALRQHLDRLAAKFAAFREASGSEILGMIDREGWEEVCRRIGQNVEELHALESEHPEEYKKFREAQLAALANRGEGLLHGHEEDGEVAVGD